MTKVLVCGGRDFNNQGFLFDAMDSLHKSFNITCVINGGAPGADTLSQMWAQNEHVEVKTYMADWIGLGRKAGPIRNQKMLDENPDIGIIIAFPGGRGTENMISKAKAAGKQLIQFAYTDSGEEITKVF